MDKTKCNIVIRPQAKNVFMVEIHWPSGTYTSNHDIKLDDLMKFCTPWFSAMAHLEEPKKST